MALGVGGEDFLAVRKGCQPAGKQGGVGHAGADAVDGDTVARKVERGCAGEVQQGALGYAVREHAGLSLQAVKAGQEHDRALPAKENLWSLLANGDILIENMRPGKLEAFGFGPDELLARNPRLVIVRVTGFGPDGPYAMHPGFATIAEAMSGFSGLLGEAGGQPLLPPVALTNEVTALVGAFATLAALSHAEHTGGGQAVDVSLLASMFQIMGPLPSAYAHLGYLQPRLGSGIPYTVPRGTYRCADGVWVALPIRSHAGCSTWSAWPRMTALPVSRAAASTGRRLKNSSSPGSPRGHRRR